MWLHPLKADEIPFMTGISFSKSSFRSWPAYIPWLIIIIVFWVIANTSLKKDYKTGLIENDAKGYYAYLPAFFIYHDFNFRFYYQIERVTYTNSFPSYQYLRVHNNKTINKYYAGTAVCLIPFFVTGHIITLIAGLPADGYSYYYTLLVHIGALFYLFLALIGLRKLLRTYQIEEHVIALIMLAIVFGTNIFYYVITEFAMSHLYSFTAITWFCYNVRMYFTGKKSLHLVYIALLLGIITLIRPVNLMILLSVPFLAGSRKQLLSGFIAMFEKKGILVLAIICFLAIVSVQLIIYKLSTGSFIVYSYKQEGFNFQNPQVLNFLFSYRKGMFVYTPLLFLSLAGLINMFRTSRFSFFSLLGFLYALVYVLSSWHMWFYGGSFSQRVMIDFYAFFSILLAIAIQGISYLKIKKVFISLIVLVIIVCQVQTYQYRKAHIHWSEMTKEKYWDSFLRLDRLIK